MPEPVPQPARKRTRRAPGPGERQRDPERTRERILDAATVEFAAKGFAGARVGEIAARAGVNKQLISYYFGGKSGLYRAIGDRWLRAEEEAGYGDMPLAEVVRSYVPASERTRSLTRLLVWEGMAGDTQAAADADDAGDAGEVDPAAPDDAGAEVRAVRMRDALADVRRRQETGELVDDLDPGCVLLAFMAAATAPVTLPHIARAIFGEAADSEEFAGHYADQLARIVALLRQPDGS